MPHRIFQPRGFTLIELIMVLMIISISIAIAAPSLRGWGQAQKLRYAADGFIAATGYARSRAVTNAAVTVVEVDSAGGTYAVKSVGKDGVRKAVPSDFGQAEKLSDGWTIRVVSGGGTVTTNDAAGAAGVASIVFYPDGRNTPAVVEIVAVSKDVARIASDSPADPFRRIEVAK